jgi:hypothetical protein
VERADAAAPQSRQHALYVLASPKAVDLMIDAATAVVEAVKGF